MRFVIDENVPIVVARELAQLGHDCFVLAEQAAQTIDVDVMAMAVEQRAILVTFDADFGRLIFHEMRPAPVGVVYMQSRPRQAELVGHRFVDLVRRDSIDIEGRYIVIDMAGIRSLPLKTG